MHLIRPDKYIWTVDQGLVLLAVTDSDAGSYVCYLEGETGDKETLLCSFQVTVDRDQCLAPAAPGDYRSAYAEWCREMRNYQRAFDQWSASRTVGTGVQVL